MLGVVNAQLKVELCEAMVAQRPASDELERQLSDAGAQLSALGE